MITTCVGLAAGQQDRSEVEHLLALAVDLLAGVVLACTHVIEGAWAASVETTASVGEPGELWALLQDRGAADVAVCVRSRGADPRITDPRIDVAGPVGLRHVAVQASLELAERSAGRAVLFPGQERLTGEIATDDVPSLSAIRAVEGIAGTPTVGTRLVTRDFVRPVLRAGALVLQVRPFGEEGRVAPFEVPDPTPCCAAHG